MTTAQSLLKKAEELACTCGADGSDEGHTPWCKWSEMLADSAKNCQPARVVPLQSPSDAVLGSARVQLQAALRMAERDGSDLVSVPLSVAELRGMVEALQKIERQAETIKRLWMTAVLVSDNELAVAQDALETIQATLRHRQQPQDVTFHRGLHALRDAREVLTKLKAEGLDAGPPSPKGEHPSPTRAEMVEALEPFAKIAERDELHERMVDGYFTVNLGVMNGNVTQSVIRFLLTVDDFRKARAILTKADSESGEKTK